MEKKTFYLAQSGKNQIPFKDLDSLIDYFSEAGKLFEDIANDIQFFKVDLEKLPTELETLKSICYGKLS